MPYRRYDAGELFAIPEMVKVTDNRWHAMDIAPDGSAVVFKWNRTGAYELYLAPLASGAPRQLTSTDPESQCVHPRWSPTGERIAFLRDRGGDRRFHIWTVDPVSGAEQRITSEPIVSADSRIEWSPDGTRLAFRSWLDGINGLWLTDLRDHDVRRIVPEIRAATHGNGVLPSWSHDGRFIAFQTATAEDPPSGASGYRVPRNEVLGVTRSDGSCEAWTIVTHGNEHAHALFPRWSPDDDALAFTTDVRGRLEGALVPVRDGRQAGPVRYLTAGTHDESLLGFGQSGRVLYRRAVEGTVLPCRVDPESGADETLVEGQGVCYAFREAADGTIAYVWSTPTTPPELYVKPQGRPARQLTHSLPAGFDPTALVRPRHVWYPGAGDRAVPAILWEPLPEARADDDGARPPAIVMAHGGGTRQHFQLWDPIAQFFANNGYVVLEVNARGSQGYGRAHRDGYAGPDEAPNAMMGDEAVVDHVRGADWLEAEGVADGARIAIIGPSAGGWLTVKSLLHSPSRFAAGVPSRGVPAVARAADGRVYAHRAFASPVAPPPSSEADFLERIRVPVLVLGGKNDPMIPASVLEAFSEALRSIGKSVDIHIYPDEGHGYRNRANMRDAFVRHIAFLDATVKLRRTQVGDAR